jgi:type I restriction enzyme, S subunit
LKEIERATSSTTVKHLSHGDVEGIRRGLPSLDEQQAIARVLSDMDAEITALEQRRDKTKAIKQGMMQSLLTGRVRLVENG